MKLKEYVAEQLEDPEFRKIYYKNRSGYHLHILWVEIKLFIKNIINKLKNEK